MSTFADHVERTRRTDGEYDAAAAEQSRAAELAQSPDAIESLAHKAAAAERAKWERENGEHLRKQYSQLTLEGLDLDALVPLGNSTFVEMRDMDEPRIRTRVDLRTDVHIRELDAFAREVEFWRRMQSLLPPGGTIGDIA